MGVQVETQTPSVKKGRPLEIEFRVRCVTPGSTLYACLEIDAATSNLEEWCESRSSRSMMRLAGSKSLLVWEACRPLGTIRTRAEARGSRAARNGRFRKLVSRFRRRMHRS